ncbi:uncharacterized protein LOC143018869 isoform X2 [Oratosquilla oratoria]|uniref:uncharacterized protein LOC143018869 isoform X2 n=1 Tax=Oratosquilla oratoria TaxID=337810 RepID=UPI003F766CA1
MRLFIFCAVALLSTGALADDDYDTQSRITTGGTSLRQSVFSGPVSTFDRVSSDPCSSDPCGENTRCEPAGNAARCRCLEGYVPNDHTIKGCRPQCTSARDCPDDMTCRIQKCVRVCEKGACGLLADCVGSNHQPKCTCPHGYGGDPYTRCTREQTVVREPPVLDYNLCVPNPCGENADCEVGGRFDDERPVCSCQRGYFGDPLTYCERAECIDNNDCPLNRNCQGTKCIDPCTLGKCGDRALCEVKNHNPVCSCDRGFTGDPLIRCRPLTPDDFCRPSPCGRGAICKPGSERATCACPENYIGDPLSECRPECERDSDCDRNQACRRNRCRNPCVDSCGEGAHCEVRNHRASCSCPEFYLGDPYTRCYPECTRHEDCQSNKACIKLKCGNPCGPGICGEGADCKVENHQPICSCPKGYTGHPFERCRPFSKEDLCARDTCGHGATCTPGFDRDGNDRPVCICPEGYIGNPLFSCNKGECRSHNECQDNKSCYQYLCVNSCSVNGKPVCGENALCTVKNHSPVCSCQRGYEGDPRERCYPRSGSSHGVRARFGY